MNMEPHEAARAFIADARHAQIRMTTDGRPVFDGATLFEIKATHGFPLDMAIDRIMVEKGMEIDWAGYINAARKNGWWDFQIHDSLLYAMQDAMLPKDRIMAIMDRFKAYVMRNIHPKMVGV
jgi:hypothetical protein